MSYASGKKIKRLNTCNQLKSLRVRDMRKVIYMWQKSRKSRISNKYNVNNDYCQIMLDT